MRARFFPFFLILTLTALAADGAAQAPETSPPFSVVTAEWNRVLDGAERHLGGPEQDRERVLEYREQVQRIRDEATARKQQAEQELAKTRQLLEALGPVPAEGEAPEPGAVTAKRQQFAADVAFHRARTAQAELALTRANALDTAISASLRERLVEGLVGRTPLPFAPSTIAVAVPEFLVLLETLGRSPVNWYGGLNAQERGQVAFYRFALLALFAAALGWGVRRLLLRRFGRDPAIADPSYARRLGAAIAGAVARGIVPAFILGAFILWMSRQETLVADLFADAVSGVLVALFFFVLATALTRAVLAPELPSWTLTRLAPESARLISRRIVLLAAVFAVDLFFDTALVGVYISPELDALYTLSIAALATLGILALVPARLWRPAEETEAEAEEASLWVIARRLAAALAIVAVAAIVIGYGRLGWYLISNLLLTGLVLGALILARGLLRDLIGALMRSALVREVLDVRHRARERIKFWFRAALNPVLLVAGFLFVAPFWGLSRADLARWTSDIIQGFEIGGVTISIADIALGLATFVVVLALTRLLQRSLSERILPQTELEPGVRHSLAAGAGYVGLILAATLAVAVLGIDLTDIALIAGALSVGIGFGLQNVVNNFVSGLILLVERPIKMGDWIVVGGNEGFVKRITVRATELETWQYASVIIPNSEILSSALLNWTHKDRYGRIEISVGVAYGSPTERVREILLECAKAHSQVLDWPASSVLFDDFGASSLDFQLRCYTSDVVKKQVIASDLRFAIDQRFRDEGIEIPFPQRVVHYAEAPPDEARASESPGAPK